MPKIELVGGIEIGIGLGVSRQRAGQLCDKKGFPDPVAELKMGRIWLKSEVINWCLKNGREWHG